MHGAVQNQRNQMDHVIDKIRPVTSDNGSHFPHMSKLILLLPFKLVTLLLTKLVMR